MKIEQEGIIKEQTKGAFIVTLPDHNDHEVLCKPSGKMRYRNITLVVGDKVKIEMSPYDLTRGRITWRL